MSSGPVQIKHWRTRVTLVQREESWECMVERDHSAEEAGDWMQVECSPFLTAIPADTEREIVLEAAHALLVHLDRLYEHLRGQARTHLELLSAISAENIADWRRV